VAEERADESAASASFVLGRASARGWGAKLRWHVGRLRVRLLIVNLVVLLVPVAGLEFARVYERQLLGALERDMRHQAHLTRAMVELDLEDGRGLDEERHHAIITRAAADTRTRIRILDAYGAVAADSHDRGPPEGPEPLPPTLLGSSGPSDTHGAPTSRRGSARAGAPSAQAWPDVPRRREVRDALAGHPSARTRIREREPGVILFVTEPIRSGGQVTGVVYVTRSTAPVMVELYRIRSGLLKVLGIAAVFVFTVSLLLAWSISRPLSRLSRAANRIASGERDVPVRVEGSGEVRELGEAFAAMTRKLEARTRFISEFAADVAHEFKSPLTSIRGAAELLGEGADDDPEARTRFLRNIQLDAQRLDRLVSRLLELSRIEASNEALTVVDLDTLLRRVGERAAAPDRPVRVTYRAASRLVRAREADLETALLNVVENAVRFSPEDATVDMEVSGGGARTLRVQIADRGPGVPEGLRSRVFDRFFTTDAERDGTGLGLAIVKSVVTAHGGRVGVEARPGGGALFVIELDPA